MHYEIEDMDAIVKEDVENESLRDEDMFRINEKIKDLDHYIALKEHEEKNEK